MLCSHENDVFVALWPIDCYRVYVTIVLIFNVTYVRDVTLIGGRNVVTGG